MRATRLISTIAAVASTWVVAGPASAITNGSPDGSAHPEVGVVVAQLRGSMHYGCSGTLVAPTVFLTAAHCNPALIGVPVTGLGVYFNSTQLDPNLIPATDLHAGTFVPSPAFEPNPGGKTAGTDTHDIAVILLDAPVAIPPASLPPAGILDQLAVGNGLHGQQFTNVGYGGSGYTMGGGPPQLDFPAMRMDSTSTFLALDNAYIRESENQATGNGGTCNFDSGGPQFFPGTHELASITLDGNPYCTALDVDYRVDTQSARSFLAQYVPLP